MKRLIGFVIGMAAVIGGWAQSPEYLVRVVTDANGTVAITKNGESVSGGELMASANDTVVITATPAEGNRFIQWKAASRAGLAEGSYLGNATVTLHPTSATTLTAHWVTPKTRTWNPTKKEPYSNGLFYLFRQALNWLDDEGGTGMPLIGDTVIFGNKKVDGGAYRLSDDSVNNALYEVRYMANAKVGSMNQGSFALVAGGEGLQFLDDDNSNPNWSGIYIVGDGILPINIVNNVDYVMQKGCASKDFPNYVKSPIILKQGKGRFINYCQCGGYSYTIPKTIIQEGTWDITITAELNNRVICFDGDASKCLSFSYAGYAEDLVFKSGGITETPGTSNHTISADGDLKNIVFKETPRFNPMVFSGRFVNGAGLTWMPSNANYSFVCSNAVSDTNGRILVEKGTVKLVDGASFSSLSEISVADGAVFEVADDAGAGLHSETLVVGGASARVKLGDGVVLAVNTATFAGRALSPGHYAAEEGAGVKQVAWIEGAGIVTVNEGPAASATWGGGETNTSVEMAGNWVDGTVPDFASGDLLATFANGGTCAHLSGAATFSGIALANDFDGNEFVFEADAGARATINSTGVNAAPLLNGPSTTWTMSWPLVAGVDQGWVIGTNNTFELNGGISGDATVTVQNAGSFHLNSVSLLTGALDICGGNVRVSVSDAFGPADKTVALHHDNTKYTFAGDIKFDSPIYGSDVIRDVNPFMAIEPRSHVTFNGNFGWKGNGAINFGTDSVTVFNGGLRFTTDGMDGKLHPRGSGTMIVSNSNISTCQTVEGASGHPVTIVLCSQWNVLNSDSYWTKIPAGRLVTHVANAVQKNTRLDISGGNTTFDLCGNDQEVLAIHTSAQSKITSDAPATLKVSATQNGNTSMHGDMGGENRVNRATFSGYVSFLKAGTYPHAFGAVSTTTGSVEVVAGTVKFTSAAAWPNATEVRVNGGTLHLQNAVPFGKETVWKVTTGTAPVMSLDFDGITRCAKLVLNGNRLQGGLYGSIGSGAKHEVDWITGTGLLHVISDGTTIIFR